MDLKMRIENTMTRRRALRAMLAGGVGAAGMAALAGCGETQVVEVVKEVAVEKVVTQIVEKVVEKKVEVEKKLAEPEFEVFSWWTNAGEVEGLNALFQIFQARKAGVQIINAAIAGGAGPGGNAKAVLQTRMLAGNPPDSFQIHWGHELIDEHVVAGRVEPLDSLWEEQGLFKVFPEGFVNAGKYEGKVWAVPVNIHRSNVMWYDKAFFADNKLPTPKDWTSWDDAFVVFEDIKKLGRTPFALGEGVPFYTSHVFENVLIAVLGPDDYAKLFSGEFPWTDPKVTKALEVMDKIIGFSNPDYLSVEPAAAFEMALNGVAATTINGDWAEGFYRGKGYDGKYGWAPSPGTKGVYNALSDAFPIPKGAKNRENAAEWCRVNGSLDGQNQFNHFKGSIPVRTDASLSYFNSYQKEAINDWNTDHVVPSIVHGFAARQSWITAFVNALNVFAAERKIDATQKTLVTDCKDAEVCK